MRRIIPGSYSTILRRTEGKGNSVARLEHGVEVRGLKREHFVLKRTRVSPQDLQKWVEVWRKLKALKIPTSSKLEAFPGKSLVTLKQRDYSKGASVQMMDAWRVPNFRGEFEKPLLGIVRDIATMHKSGISLSPHEHLTSAWVVYKKPNGKFERAIVDYGTLIPNSNRISVRGNFESLLPKLKAHGDETTLKALKIYFRINPDAQLKEMASAFLGKRI